MSKELTSYEIEQAQNNAVVADWQEQQAAQNVPVINRQARVLLEAAADNPVAMAIFARTILRGESYAQAVDFIARRVTNRNISVGAARVLVHRMNRTITGE